ncbi:MAG TPA: hypothetical protein VEV86_17020, partial [Vicinamibacterales bacterium]|nr:hypothetical protein [Vicinamibacterales bacterium]
MTRRSALGFGLWALVTRAMVAVVCFACAVPLAAQRGQGRQGGAPSARASAPVDLTGMWVSIV